MSHGRRAARWAQAACFTLGAIGLGSAVPAGAQLSNQFGVQDRANAAQRMIVLAVQQGISSLPPTSGQSLTFEFSPELDTYVASKQLGPTSFRSPQTVGAGNFSLRVATSYFRLDETLGPINYLAQGSFFSGAALTRFGLAASADVVLFNFGLNYGITNRLEVNFNLPLVVVDAGGSEVFISRATSKNPVTVGVDSDTPAAIAEASNTIDSSLQSGDYVRRQRRFASLSSIGVQFQDATNVGVGRISLGLKAVLYGDKTFQFAFAPEFYLPSPNQDELAGSDSAAILPRFIAQARAADWLRFHLDAGYDADFSHQELRRFVWNIGTSVPWKQFSFDTGFGGSKFNKGITWTPAHATLIAPDGSTNSLTALGDNELGSNFVDFLAGAKMRLTDRFVISGAVNVPINNEGFRADAVGTIAAEVYF